ncbi:hypothetical protein RM545_03180 [Zunongwangia sp. F260]|uniref:Uncharacterized protein n=1 Tax=Autumnicola lenta TaxID=3075593 RepID=A0ABU3CH60_9FLAO|nr:hypothetical protein [Zunongwangia sp. F260]MDT0645683.1 hypothetical protein [Zunongwangia sp. F260]
MLIADFYLLWYEVTKEEEHLWMLLIKVLLDLKKSPLAEVVLITTKSGKKISSARKKRKESLLNRSQKS